MESVTHPDKRRDAGQENMSDRRLFRWMLGYTRPFWPVMFLALCLSLLLVAADVARPYLIKVAIDNHILSRSPDGWGLLGLGALFLGLVLFSSLLQYAQQFLLEMTGQRIIYNLRQEVFAHFVRMPMSFFDRNAAGRLVTRVTNDTEALNQLYAQVVVNLVKEVLLLLAIFLVMWQMSPLLTGVCLAVMPLLFLVTQLYRRLVREARRNVRLWLSRLNAFLGENLAGMQVIQAFVREAQQQKAFDEINDAYYRAGMRIMTVNSVFQPVIVLLGNLALALLLWIGGVAALDDQVTFGVVFAFTQYVRQFFAPLSALADRFAQIQSAMASAERLFAFLQEPVGPEGRAGTAALPRPVRGEIVFDNVWFAYEEEDWVLKGVSFQVRPGETVALVGETGAGKTSITRLLSRFYECQKGSIRLDGMDIREIPVAELRSRMGIVPQDVFLFSGDIAGNIALNRAVSEERLHQVVRMVGLEAFIQSLPLGLRTPLGERGVTLSMGQRQLLAFARAIVDDPDILVLDEATAHIDSETEQAVQVALRRISQGRTMLIVAHRLSTIRHADKIILLERGRIVEMGTHEALLAKGGRYKELYTLQRGPFHFVPQFDKMGSSRNGEG